MCILINHPANTNFDSELLADFYSFNSDGFGAMYAENGQLNIVKTLGSPEEIEKLYKEELAHRDCVIHYRMKTHGDIDMDNCHPYKVTDEIWLAHNGILAMGNPLHKHKSDTWHFIEFILRPVLTAHPEMMFNLEFQEYLAEMIGVSNKFALMDTSGQAVIINEGAGVTYQGAWLSNTYAWSANKYGVGYTSKYYTSWEDDSYSRGTKLITSSKYKYGGTSSKMTGWDEYEDEYPVAAMDDGVLYDIKPKAKPVFSYNKVLRAAYNCYCRGSAQLVDWVVAVPEKAEFLLLEWYGEVYENEMAEMVNADPEEAAGLLASLFADGSINETDVA